jgi:hypothetical protein
MKIDVVSHWLNFESQYRYTLKRIKMCGLLCGHSSQLVANLEACRIVIGWYRAKSCSQQWTTKRHVLQWGKAMCLEHRHYSKLKMNTTGNASMITWIIRECSLWIYITFDLYYDSKTWNDNLWDLQLLTKWHKIKSNGQNYTWNWNAHNKTTYLNITSLI